MDLFLLVSGRDGVARNLAGDMSNLQFGNAINGGFGACTFDLPGRVTDIPAIGVDFLNDLRLVDAGGNTLFHGRVEDLATSLRASTNKVTVSALGYQTLLEETYENLFVIRNIPWVPRQVSESPTLILPNKFNLAIGQFTQVGSDDLLVGYGVEINATGAALNINEQYGVTFKLMDAYTGAGGSGVSQIQRVKWDGTMTSNAAAAPQLTASVFIGNEASYGAALVSVTANGTVSQSAAAAVGTGNIVLMILTATGAHTPTAGARYRWANIRIIGRRNGTVNGTNNADEPVYGHEMIRDIIEQTSLLRNGGIDSDTSYVHDEMSWVTATTFRQAIEDITRFHNAYWGVWEDKKFEWRLMPVASNLDYTVQASDILAADLSSSIADACNIANLRYTDLAGRDRRLVLTDNRYDNVFNAVGATRGRTFDTGFKFQPSGASLQSALGGIIWPDRSYEVLRGTITLPLTTMVRGGQEGGVPAYRLRAGKAIRMTDAAPASWSQTPRFDRRSRFVIRQVDVDWDGGNVTLSVDNSRDLLTQYLARAQTTIAARLGI